MQDFAFREFYGEIQVLKRFFCVSIGIIFIYSGSLWAGGKKEKSDGSGVVRTELKDGSTKKTSKDSSKESEGTGTQTSGTTQASATASAPSATDANSGSGTANAGSGAAKQTNTYLKDYPYYPSYFNDAITAAYKLTRAGNFSDAANYFYVKDSTGTVPIEYRKDVFLNGGLSQNVYDDVSALESNVRARVKDYQNLQKKLSTISQDLKSGLDSYNPASPEKSASSLDKVKSVMKEFVSIRNTILSDGKKLETTFNNLKGSRAIQDASYLSYLTKFIMGTGRTEYTGIIGAIDRQWDTLLMDLIGLIEVKGNELSKGLASVMTQDALLAYPSDLTAISDKISGLRGIVPIMDDFLKINGTIKPLETSYKSSKTEYKTNLEASRNYLETLCTKSDELLLFASDAAEHIYQVYDFIDKSSAEVAQDMRDKVDKVTDFFVNESNTLARLSNTAAERGKEVWLKTVFTQDVPKWESAAKAYTEGYEAISKACMEYSGEAIVSAGTRIINAGKQMYVEDSEKYQALMSLIPDASDENARQMPSKLLSSISTFRQIIDLDVKTLKEGSAVLSRGSSTYSSNIQLMQKKINDSITNIQKLSSQTDALSSQAKAQQREALQAQNQINIYYNRSLTAYRQANYKSARTNLDRAMSLYESSYDSLKRDVMIQEETYDNLNKLKQDIAEKQKPLLVQELRSYKNSARTSYYAGDFDEASNQINQADEVRNSWCKFMDIEMDSDEELERLRNLVNVALSIKSGKELNPNDALYPEMSQILSMSNIYYEQGQDLISKGNKTEGRELLSKAKNKLNELKVIYPHNQKANLLSMRIDQVLDLNQFNESFKVRFEELKAINYAKRDTTAQNGYSDLQDLHEISPNYPGLSDFMYKVELDLGLKQIAVAPTSAAAGEAGTYAKQAKEQLDSAGRDTMLLANAKSLANKALALDPNNDVAIAVLDEVALRTGAQAAVVLSASDEAKYQQAITYLQNGNVIAANSNLQELLKNPANRRSAKVQKLQSRIKGMLN